MKLSSKQLKIAKRLFLAYSYRVYIKSHNFDSTHDKGMVIFNYYHYPVFIVYNNGDDTFTGYKTIDDKDSFYRYTNYSNNSNLGNYIHNMFMRYTNNIRNFRMAIFNYILQNRGIPDETCDFMVFSSRKICYTYDEIKQFLMKNYDVSISQLNKITNNVSEQKNQFNIENMTFKSDQPIDEEKIKRCYDKIKGYLSGSSLINLLYGNVEIKDEFVSNNSGDYNPSDDLIRTGGNQDDFVEIFVHELGHRWRNKSANRNQIAQFKKLYDNCNGKHIVLKEGDVITFYGSDKKFIYISKAFGSLILKGQDGNNNFYKLIATRSMNTLNGQKIEKYKFPSNYSRTKLDEFISECISYTYCNKSMDENLKARVKEIIG